MTDLATTVLGLAGAVLGAAIAVPQAWRAVRTGTAGISAATFQLLFSLGLTWMLYGFAEDLHLLALSDGILAIATLVVLGAMVRDGLDAWRCARAVIAATALAFVVAAIDAVVLGWLAAVLSLVLRYPQIRLVRSAASIEGVSLSTWNIAAATNACWCAYGVLHRDPRLAVATLLNLVVTVVLVRSVVVRRRPVRAVMGG